MKFHIHYFSATGNTWLSVREIEVRLREEGHEVESFLIGRDAPAVSAVPDRLIAAYPVWAWNAPPFVRRYLSRLPRGEGTKAAVLAVDGGGGANAAFRGRQILQKRGYKVFLSARAGFTENWMQVMPAPDNTVIERKNDEGLTMVREFTDHLVSEKEKHYRLPLLQRFLCRLISGLYTWPGAPSLGKLYIADQDCTRCGLCRKTCPTGAILQRNDRALPFWNFSCTSCNRCINICPAQAINSSPMRIILLHALLITLLCGILPLYGGFIDVLFPESPWIAMLKWGGSLLITGLSIPVIFSLADYLIIRPLQRVPGVRRVFEWSFTKNFRRYFVAGFKKELLKGMKK